MSKLSIVLLCIGLPWLYVSESEEKGASPKERLVGAAVMGGQLGVGIALSFLSPNLPLRVLGIYLLNPLLADVVALGQRLGQR